MTTKQPQTLDLRSGIRRRALQIALMILYQTAILFLASGRFDWIWAWVFIGLYLVGISTNAVLLMKSNPETIAERSRAGESMKGWDRVVGGLWGLVYFVFLLIVAGLDARYHWTGQLSLDAHFGGVAVFGLGGALFSWAMVTNAFFSTVVRIQDERGHTVCTTGPYRFVRHPGYVGAILQSLEVPLLLGSLWALIPGVIAAVLIVVRTALEDRTLIEELEGYREYTRETRYRLLPGVW